MAAQVRVAAQVRGAECPQGSGADRDRPWLRVPSGRDTRDACDGAGWKSAGKGGKSAGKGWKSEGKGTANGKRH